MRLTGTLSLAALLLPALGGCGSGSDPGPGAVTADEARALDEAAEMIERDRLPEEALRPPPVITAAPSASSSAPPATGPATGPATAPATGAAATPAR